MSFEDPTLPYSHDALEPHISKETLSFHFDKHHLGYVSKLRAAIADSDQTNQTLEEIIASSNGGLFNNAAQVWNHSFYWNSLSPNGGGEPKGKIASLIDDAFGSFENFKTEFAAAAMGNFASGWTWLVQDSSGKLSIVNTDDAETVLTHSGQTAILTLDVWEHAYYLQYKNERDPYVDNWWKIVYWPNVEKRFEAARMLQWQPY